MKAEITTHTTQDAVENDIVKGKVIKKSGKRIGYNYIIVKSLKQSQKNDVVKCLYIKSLTNFGFCVIKEGTFGDSKDKEGRDIKDRLIWQKQLHELLQNKVRVPRLLGSFEENGNYYLVIERIKGKALGSLCKKHSKKLREGLLTGSKLGRQFLDYLLQIIGLLEGLHQQHIVHRDATSNNFMITPGGKVAVIDMELSYSLELQFPSPVFQLGTHGYMSPEQIAAQTPTIQEDVFSAGAVLLQVWANISPNKLTDAPIDELTKKIHFFIPDQQFADVVIQCLQPEPGKRPALSAVRQVVHQYKKDLSNKVNRTSYRSIAYNKDEILETVQQAIGTLCSPLLADPQRGWFAEDIKKPDSGDKYKIDKAWYASYQTGAAGVIYLLSKLRIAGLDVDASRPFVEKGLDRIASKYIDRNVSTSPSLYFGAAGIAASLITAMQSGLIDEQAQYWDWINQLLQKENSALGLMYGVAGQGIADLTCATSPQVQGSHQRLLHYVRYLLDQQENNGAWLRSLKDKKKRVTRGFSQGMAGIIYFLLGYGQHYDDKHAIAAAERGLQWLIKKASRKDGGIQWRSARGKEVQSWWSEGAAGIALSFLKAWELQGSSRYRHYAIGALNNHPDNVLDNNLSQANGLSGLGEIYLEAYRVLKDDTWLKRAGWIAQVLMQLKKQHPKYGPYWLVQNERQPVPGFMTGNSGVLHFLARYCYPDSLHFPLLPGNKQQQSAVVLHQTALQTS